MKPLQTKLCKQFYWKDIPFISWFFPQLIQLFKDMNISVTSGPMLAHYNNPDKPTFFKTDCWSADSMGWILMQPADDKETVGETNILKETGKCLFDLCKNGARLWPIA